MKENKILFLILFLFALCGCSETKPNIIVEPVTEMRTNYASDVPNMRVYDPDFLLLVNKEHPVPEEYLKNVELITTKDIYDEDVQVERFTYDAFLRLRNYLVTERGIDIGIRTSYRSLQDQQEVWDYYIRTKGYDYAAKITAPVGCSEHHTGLAIDITPKYNDHWEPVGDEIYSAKGMYEVIHSVLKDYGFILRYPKGKEHITGYQYESWHIRYVGNPAAEEIYNNNWTLEEYYDAHFETLEKQSN